MRNRAFTLIELLIAFAISTVLLGAIYFFYVGFVKTGELTRRMAFLNMVVDNKLEIMTRDIKSAVEVIEFRPRLMRFKRYKLPKGELSAIDLETRRLETVEYRVVKREGSHVFLRQIGFETPVEQFRVRDCGEEVFKGYVLQSPEDLGKKKKAKEDENAFPRFKLYDTVSQSDRMVKRIPLVKIDLKLDNGSDHVHVISKVFMPLIFAGLVEPDWNAE